MADDDFAKVRVVGKAGSVPFDRKMVVVPTDDTQRIKVGASLDPKLTALVQQMKELAQQTPHGAGHIRVMPPGVLPDNNCACGCSCS
jgi:hypothetical protein